MAEKRPYKESDTVIIARIDERVLGMQIDMKEVRKHLEKLNTGTEENRVTGAKNSTHISWIVRIGGSLFALGGTALLLKLFGIY